MLIVAEKQFALAMKSLGDGEVGLEAHLRQAEKSGVDVSAYYPQFEIPEELQYLWGYFLSLSTHRQGGGMGPSGLAFTEIEAWGRFYGIELSPWELGVVLDLDTLWLKEAYRARPSRTEPRNQ